MRFSSLGVELAVAIAVPAYLGLLVDRRLGTDPIGFLVGFFFGLTGGLYRFFSAARRAMQGADGADRAENHEQER